ncbi:MAG: carboxylesterase [Nitrospirales bacterium]|nr:MAG: carboxylesterase [Nitrospirales bacterium]
MLAGATLVLIQPSFESDLTSSTAQILDWENTVTLETELGRITGLSNGRANAFLAVRYGQPPTGERRFLPAVAAQAWQGNYNATSFPNIAMQSDVTPLEDNSSFNMSEDSLFLNIFTPATAGENRPVLFWIHGGSFTGGSANTYDGSVLAEQGDVIVVTINYRLGLFGFLDLSAFGEEFAGSTSNGIRDQILALRWVADNIADYGGDGNNITLFGESAGGQSVLSILSAPSADGLYAKAIVHSGSSVGMPPANHSQPLAEYFDVELSELPNTLRQASAAELFAAQEAVSFSNGGNIDGTVITRSSNEAILEHANNGVPIIAGSNRDEGTLFSALIPWPLYGVIGEAVAPNVVPGSDTMQYLANMKKAYPDDSRTEHFERIWTEFLRRGAVNSAARASAAGPGGWLYRFDMPVQRGLPLDMGVPHAAEIQFTFNLFAGDAPDTAFMYNRNDNAVRELAKNWSSTIIQFARTGDPNGAGLPYWPRYTAETRESMILDSTPRVEAFVESADRERWGDTEVSSADFLQ